MGSLRSVTEFTVRSFMFLVFFFFSFFFFLFFVCENDENDRRVEN
jgi:hypothetical protein